MITPAARTAAVGLLGALTIAAASGCSWNGINSLPLPGTKGTGEDAWTVQVEMPDVTTLTGNARVRVADVNVGTVRDIAVEGDHALVTISLDPGVELPANTRAKIGQTSLLGSAHLELSPPVTEPATGRLHDGDRIPLLRAGDYPTTEQTLSTLSFVLTGGGIGKIEEINKELGDALAGREEVVRNLLTNVEDFVDRLNTQRDDIVQALEGLDRLSQTVADDKHTLDEAVKALDPSLTVLNEQREDLTAALTSLGRLSEVADRVVSSNRSDLDANLRDLQPVLQGLADAGPALPSSLSVAATFPFPLNTYRNAVQGDYANLFLNLDLTTARLDKALLTGTPAAGQLASLGGLIGKLPPLPPVQGNPLITPLDHGRQGAGVPTPPNDEGGR